MSKLGFFATISTIVGALAIATFSSSSTAEADAPPACSHTEFKTQMVKEACAKGGQKEAKAVMQTFMKANKIKSCNVCHSKLAPKYELKADGLEQFTKAGGK